MGIDVTRDPQLELIAMLCKAAIQGELGAENLVSIFDTPRDLRVLGLKQLPALAVYVHAEQKQRMSASRYIDELLVVFDYIRPPTAPEARDRAHPPLRHVWHAIVDVLQAGTYPSVNGGAEALEALGCMEVRDGTERIQQYGYLGDEARPWFRGQMRIEYSKPDVDWDALDDFLKMFTGWTQPGVVPYDDPDNPVTDDYLVRVPDVIPPEDTPELEMVIAGDNLLVNNGIQIIV